MIVVKALVSDWGNIAGKASHVEACKAFEKYSKLHAADIYNAIFRSGIEKEFDEGRISPEQFYEKVCSAIKVSQHDMSIQQCKEAWQKVILGDNDAIKFVFELLRKDIKLFLLLNTNVWHWEIIQELPVVREYFPDPEQWILSFEIHNRKPHSAMYEEAVRRAGCDIKHCVYQDDIAEFAQKFGKMGGQWIQFDCNNDAPQDLMILYTGLGMYIEMHMIEFALKLRAVPYH